VKKAVVILAILALMQFAVADVHYLGNGSSDPFNQSQDLTYNGTGPQYNDSNLTANASGGWPQINLPSVNTTQIGNQVTDSGNAVADFLASASPYLLIIVGIIVIVLAGFVRILGIALILLGAFKIISDILGWKLW